MNCKNCNNELKEESKFRNICGAKVIHHRLNFKSVTEEFFSTFISWDNKFFITVRHLLTKPQLVANGYLDGVRKRYMQPFAYMIIALSLYGIYMYFAKEKMLEYSADLNLKMESVFEKNNLKVDKASLERSKNVNEALLKYFNLLTFAMIPLISIVNYFLFKSKNLIEHNVSLLYAYATYLIGFLLVGFLGLIFLIPFNYIYYFSSILMILYHMYFYKKMFQLSFGEIILKTLLFWILLGFLFIITMIIIFIVGVIYGKFFM